jgi:hypothetical protein
MPLTPTHMTCPHTRAIIGLDAAWCPDCKKYIPPALLLGRDSSEDADSEPLLAEEWEPGLEVQPVPESFPPAVRLSDALTEDAHPAPLLAETNIAPATIPPALPPTLEAEAKGLPAATAGGREKAPKVWRSVRYTRSHGSLYYRFAWGRGHRIEGDVHIKGGAIDSPVAAARAEQVQRWINQGVDSNKIAEMIRQW